MYIAEDKDLEAFCLEAKKAGLVGVDTEFLREKTYRPELCLIQLATDDIACVVDPFAITNPKPLVDIFEDTSVIKIFHACSQDLEVLRYAYNCKIEPIFDTQIAACFLGYRMQLGYAALVQSLCGVTLSKAETLTDWSKRPLDKEQLIYAQDDVIYIPRMYHLMYQKLLECNRLGIVLPEMDKLIGDGSPIDPYTAYLKVKRINTLTRKQLSVARELAAWREETAVKKNLPRRFLLSDEIVVELAKRLPKNEHTIRKIRGFESMKPSYVVEILAAIKRGVQVKPEDYPELMKKRSITQETESIIDLMYAVLRLISEKENIASQMIATRDDLHDFYRDPKSLYLREGWRYEVFGVYLDKLLAGEIGLTIKDNKVEIL